MKTLLLVAVLLMSVAVLAEDKMTIIPITAERFSGAVQFPQSVKGDQAIVRVFYWADTVVTACTACAPVHLLRSKEFVIPVVAGVAVAFDEIPARQDQVRNVEVTLVSNVGKQDFDSATFKTSK